MGGRDWTCQYIVGSGTVVVALSPDQTGKSTNCVQNLRIFEASTKAKIILQPSVSEHH